jgi:hypothetical protein
MIPPNGTAFGPSRARVSASFIAYHRATRDEIEGMIAGRIPVPVAVSQAAE